MIDVEMILERLNTLQEYVDKLRPMQSLTPEDMQDETRYVEYWAVQRGLELATQCVLDISSHLVVGLRLDDLETFAEQILIYLRREGHLAN